MAQFSPGRLKQAREEIERSQYWLADHAGISRASVAAYEAGDTVPSANAVGAIAKATGKPIEFFFTEQVEYSGPNVRTPSEDALKTKEAK